MARTIKKAYEVFEFLKVYKADHDGNPPTYEEIQKHFGWVSIMNAWYHVERLERMGLLALDSARRITLIGGEYIPPAPE